jgi:hypothetical protein
MANVEYFSVPVNLLLQHDEEPLHCYRCLIAPDIPSGLWIRRFLESDKCLHLLRIIQRIPEIKERRCDSCLVQCGGGYDLLVLLNEAQTPPDVSAIPKIAVTLCLSTEAVTPEDPVSQFGLIGPIEVLWMHMFVSVKSGVFARNFRIFLKTHTDGFIYHDDEVDKKRIIRLRMQPDTWKINVVDFEATAPEVFAFRTTLGVPPLADTQAGIVSDSTNEPTEVSPRPRKKRAKVSRKRKSQETKKTMGRNEHTIPNTDGFSLREYLVLEKALKDVLTENDSETDCSKYSQDEYQSALHMLKLTFVDLEQSGTPSPAKKAKTLSAAKSSAAKVVMDVDESGEASNADKAKLPETGETSTTKQTTMPNTGTLSKVDKAETPSTGISSTAKQVITPDSGTASTDNQTRTRNAGKSSTVVDSERPGMASDTGKASPAEKAKPLCTGISLAAKVAKDADDSGEAPKTDKAKAPITGESSTAKQDKMSNNGTSSNIDEAVTPSTGIPSTAKQVITPNTGKPSTAKPARTRNAGKSSNCFYFPFCMFTSDICGGTQRGRCREVNSGRVTVPSLDKKEFSAAKRAAKLKLIAAEGKPCFYFPFCKMSTKDCRGTQRGRCREVNNGNVKIPSDDEFFAAKRQAMNSPTSPDPTRLSSTAV